MWNLKQSTDVEICDAKILLTINYTSMQAVQFTKFQDMKTTIFITTMQILFVLHKKYEKIHQYIDK